MQINVTYDTSVTSLPATLQADYESAVQTAVQFYENLITNPITINITFGWGEVNGSPITSNIGESSVNSGYTYTYQQLYNAVHATDTTSAVQIAAAAALPQTDPTGGATFMVFSAEAKALGLTGPSTATDGYVGLNSSDTYSWSQTNIASGSYDAVSILEHEISEVMGRSDNVAPSSDYTLLDMYRYTAADGLATDAPGAAAGALDQPFVSGYNANAYSYFSYNGTTVTLPYDTPAQVAAGQDIADWTNTVIGDSFGDGFSGTEGQVSATDLQDMNVLGYTLAASSAPPVISGTVSGQVTVDQAAIAPFAHVTVTDPNPGQTEAVKVTLSSPANGILSNLGGGIYNASTGVYTINGTAAAVTAALDGLNFIPTLGQVAQGNSVTTEFTIADTDTAGGTATDESTSVVAVSSGQVTVVSPLTTASVSSGSVYTTTGLISIAGSPVTWTGIVSATINPAVSQWTAYSGTMAEEILAVAGGTTSAVPSTAFTNSTLTALAAPFGYVGLGIWADPQEQNSSGSATETIKYFFSTPLAAGTTILLWDPGSGIQAPTGPSTFTFAASLNGTIVNTSGWSFSVDDPFSLSSLSGYSINPATGQIVVNSYNGSNFPRAVIAVTTNASISSIQVNAQTSPFDFWGLALPAASKTPSPDGLIAGLNLNQQLELIYIGYFNRAADSGGFGFWSGQNTTAQNNGQSASAALTNIANSFAPQQETDALYPILSTPNLNLQSAGAQTALGTFLDNVYSNLFDRAADAGGKAYWLGQITSGAVGLGAAVLAIANGAQGTDAIEVQNKIAVALDFTTRTGAAGLGTISPYPTTFVTAAHSVLSSVDGVSLNDASVTAGEAATTAYIANPASVGATAVTAANDPVTISASNTVTDPGPGSHTIQFITGVSADTLVLHSGATDQISGFNLAAGDVLDLRSLLSEAQLNIQDVLPKLGSYFTIADQGADAVLLFDPLGHGAGSAVAVLKALSAAVPDIGTLSSHNAILV